MKSCSQCGIEKPITDFYKGKGYAGGIVAHCKACHSLMVKKWDERNKEKRKELKRESMRKYRERHPERAKAAVNASHAKYHAKYYEKHGAKSATKRKAVKLNAYVTWANDFFIAEAYSLAKLREKVTGVKWHVDHMIPLQHDKVCGLHNEMNLTVVPASFNWSKNNRYVSRKLDYLWQY